MRRWVLILIMVLLVFGTFLFFALQYKFGQEVMEKVGEIFGGSSNSNAGETSSEKLYSPESSGEELNWDGSLDISDYPDFPESIGEYVLTNYNRINWQSECEDLNGTEVCFISNRIEYVKGIYAIHIIPVIITKGKVAYYGYIEDNLVQTGIFEGVYQSGERWELFWKADNVFDAILIQEYVYHYNEDGSMNTETQNATVSNAVVEYFLEAYPPV